MLYFILIAILIKSIFSSDIIYLEYNFNSNHNVVVNNGVLKNTVNALIKNGNESLATNSESLYLTKDKVTGMRTILTKNKSFRIDLSYRASNHMNYDGEYCLFCLVKNKKNLENGCSDIDFGVTWKSTNLLFYLRTTLVTPTCKDILFEVPLLYYKTNQTIQVSYIVENNHFSVYINSIKKISVKRKQNMDISNWSTMQRVFVGALKRNKIPVSLVVESVALSGLFKEDSKLHSFVKLPRNYKKMKPKKKLLSLHKSYSLSSLCNDLSCPQLLNCTSYDDCGVCNGNNSECSLFNQNTNSTTCLYTYTTCDLSYINQEVGSIMDVINTNYLFTVNTTKFENSTLYTNLICKNGTYLISNWVETDIYQNSFCNVSTNQVLKRNVTLGEIYECFSGKSAYLLNSNNIAHELANISGILDIRLDYNGNKFYKVPCNFNFITNVIIPSNPNVTVCGTSFLTQISATPDIVNTIDYASIVDPVTKDLKILFRTVYKRVRMYSNQTVELNSIQIVSNSGALMFIRDISGCNSIYQSNQEYCIHTWTLTTNENYFLVRTKLVSNIFFALDISGFVVTMNYFVEKIYRPPAEISIPSIEIEPKIPKLRPFREKICLFNDQNFQVPYSKYKSNQRVYFKLELIYEDHHGSNICSEVNCYIPEVMIRLESMGICVPRKLMPDVSGRISCEDLNGDYIRMIDLFDPLNEYWNENYDVVIIDNHSNCSSVITGSFIEMSTANYYYRYPAFLVFSIDLIPTPKVHPQLFKSNNGKLKTIRKTKMATKHYSSVISLGGCPYGTIYDNYMDMCVYPYVSYLASWWVSLRFVLVTLIVSLLFFGVWWINRGFIVKKERSIRPRPKYQ